MSHEILALVFQLALFLLTSSLWLGVLASGAFFLGREIAQAEQRAIQTYYDNHRANAPLWVGLQPRAWNRKSLLDWILPFALTALIAVVAGHFHWFG